MFRFDYDLDVILEVNENEELLHIFGEYASANRIVVVDASCIVQLFPSEINLFPFEKLLNLRFSQVLQLLVLAIQFAQHLDDFAFDLKFGFLRH